MGLALDLEDYHPSVLLHCWLGHLTCKIVSEMTYSVSSGTLNSTIPIVVILPYLFSGRYSAPHYGRAAVSDCADVLCLITNSCAEATRRSLRT